MREIAYAWSVQEKIIRSKKKALRIVCVCERGILCERTIAGAFN